jgi:hypothetical protein
VEVGGERVGLRLDIALWATRNKAESVCFEEQRRVGFNKARKSLWWTELRQLSWKALTEVTRLRED